MLNAPISMRRELVRRLAQEGVPGCIAVGEGLNVEFTRHKARLEILNQQVPCAFIGEAAKASCHEFSVDERCADTM